MRALITGADGQTGSYLVEALRLRGWDVHGLRRPTSELTGSTGPTGSTGSTGPTGIRWHEADLTAFTDVRDVVARVRADVVVNLAAVSSVARSWEEPLETAMVNGAAVANMLDAVLATRRDGHEPHFVQASSAEIFGDPSSSPQDESTAVAPTNPYGAAKAYAHLLVGAYRARGLSASSVVLYNHESPRRPPSFVTRKITSAAARMARGIQDSMILGNLDARRDWGWAPDYAEALALVAESRAADDFVVATGEAHSVHDFARAALRAAGLEEGSRSIRTDPAFLRPSDAPLLVGDASKIRRELGWAPTKGFQDVVTAMVEADLAALD